VSLVAPSIPPSIAETLKKPSRRGQFVHEEMLRVVFWMAYEGLDADAIWRVVNAEGGYGRDPEIPRRELERIIEGAVSKFQSGYVPPVQARDANGLPVATPKHKITPELTQRWTENAQKFVEGRTTEVGVVDFLEASPIRFSPQNCQLTLLETLFAENEIVAIKAGEYQDPDEALYVEGWRKKLRMGKRITAKKGAWLRPNPMKLGKPSGGNGTYTDADCSAVRYGFLESDALPLPLQLAMLASLRLPIVAITDSAGKSYHALVRLKGDTDEARRGWWASTLDSLNNLFGYDASNKNPSKYTRLAGAFRDEGRREDSSGEQQLIYLAKDRQEGTAIL
jgi:hypothetical protein